MSHTPFLIAGYGVTWLTIIGYVIHLRRRERAASAAAGSPSPARDE